MYGCFIGMFVCVLCACSVCRIHNASDFLVLEWQTVESCHISDVNQTRSYRRATSALNLCTISPALAWGFIICMWACTYCHIHSLILCSFSTSHYLYGLNIVWRFWGWINDENLLEHFRVFSFIMNFMYTVSALSKGFVKLNVFWGWNFQWTARHGDYIWYTFIWFVQSMYFGCTAKLEEKLKALSQFLILHFVLSMIFLRQGLYSPACPAIIWRSSWPQTHKYPPASVSGVLGLKVSTTMIWIIMKF